MFAESKIKHNLKLIKQSTLDMHRHVDTSRTLIRNGLQIYRKGFHIYAKLDFLRGDNWEGKRALCYGCGGEVSG